MRKHGRSVPGKTKKSLQEHRAYQNDMQVWSRYRMTWQDIRDLAAIQKIKCAICSAPFRIKPFLQEKSVKLKNTAANIDHDHSKKRGQPGHVRGLLCKSCNLILGYIEKHKTLKLSEMINRFHDYIKNPPQVYRYPSDDFTDIDPRCENEEFS